MFLQPICAKDNVSTQVFDNFSYHATMLISIDLNVNYDFTDDFSTLSLISKRYCSVFGNDVKFLFLCEGMIYKCI